MLLNFNMLDEDVLRSLIRNGVPEGLSIEYKSEPYGGKDDEKKEFLKDLSALANSRVVKGRLNKLTRLVANIRA